MRFFELHFNPPRLKDTRTEPDFIFNGFYYEPENIYEKRLGFLAIVGELRNVLPQNLRFLDNLAILLRKNYYVAPIKFSPETSLRNSLKKANEFLEGTARGGDVSWLGNLHLAILNLAPSQKKWWGVNFTKLGEIKILLLRNGRIIDIGKNLELSEIEPYPLKVFGNIVTGKLSEDDVVLVLTRDVFSAFSESSARGLSSVSSSRRKKGKARDFSSGSLLEKIAGLKPFEEEKIKEILKAEEKELLKISGACLICNLAGTPSEETRERKSRRLVFTREPEKFSFNRALSPLLNIMKKFSPGKILKIPRSILKKPPLSKPSPSKPSPSKPSFLKLSLPKPSLPKLSLPKISFPKISLPKLKISLPELKNLFLNKKVVSVFLFLLFLFSGFFLFREERTEELQSVRKVFEQVKAKGMQADSFLILKNEKEANLLFQEAWREILPQTKTGSPLKEEALSLKNSIEEKLLTLNKFEEVSEPELFFEFKSTETELIPQKMVLFGSDFYFFNPFSSKIYKLNITEKKGELFEVKKNVKLGNSISSSVLFLSNPNLLLFFKNGDWQERGLEKPSDDFNFSKLASFKSNIFFLDEKTGEIAKYSMLSIERVPGPQLWLNIQTKKPAGAKSMAVDGSIWVLTESNEIDRYSGGFYEKTLTINIFPFFENPSKILTSELLPYFYILEPGQSRLVILTKDGKIVKQFSSEKFDNLLDFSVSPDGKTVWLLNGLKIYQINL